MTMASLTAEDARLRDAVLRQLARAHDVDGPVGVSVNEGIATLTGVVDSCAGKFAAERATRRAPGIWAVVNDLTVRPEIDWTDADVDAAADTTELPKPRSIIERAFR